MSFEFKCCVECGRRVKEGFDLVQDGIILKNPCLCLGCIEEIREWKERRLLNEKGQG